MIVAIARAVSLSRGLGLLGGRVRGPALPGAQGEQSPQHGVRLCSPGYEVVAVPAADVLAQVAEQVSARERVGGEADEGRALDAERAERQQEPGDRDDDADDLGARRDARLP